MAGLDNIYTEMQDTYTQGFEMGKRIGYQTALYDAKFGKIDHSLLEAPTGKRLALCDLCDSEAYDTPETLQENGWGITENHAFCPTCEQTI